MNVVLPPACPSVGRRSLIAIELRSCWADNPFVKNLPCNQPADEEVGLCAAHKKEILG